MQFAARRIWQRFARLVLAAACTLIGGAARAQEGSYQFKAAVIMGIVRATEWPASKLKSGAPIVIGVFGSENAADKIRESIAGRTVRGRTVVVKLLSVFQEIDGCHAVFACGPDEQTIRNILRRTSGDPILTFGESPAFTEKGGIFLLQSGASEEGALAMRTFLHARNLKRSKLKIDDEALISARVEPVPSR